MPQKGDTSTAGGQSARDTARARAKTQRVSDRRAAAERARASVAPRYAFTRACAREARRAVRACAPRGDGRNPKACRPCATASAAIGRRPPPASRAAAGVCQPRAARGGGAAAERAAAPGTGLCPAWEREHRPRVASRRAPSSSSSPFLAKPPPPPWSFMAAARYARPNTENALPACDAHTATPALCRSARRARPANHAPPPPRAATRSSSRGAARAVLRFCHCADDPSTATPCGLPSPAHPAAQLHPSPAHRRAQRRRRTPARADAQGHQTPWRTPWRTCWRR
jgi:hypothetical protein